MAFGIRNVPIGPGVGGNPSRAEARCSSVDPSSSRTPFDDDSVGSPRSTFARRSLARSAAVRLHTSTATCSGRFRHSRPQQSSANMMQSAGLPVVELRSFSAGACHLFVGQKARPPREPAHRSIGDRTGLPSKAPRPAATRPGARATRWVRPPERTRAAATSRAACCVSPRRSRSVVSGCSDRPSRA